MINMVHTTRPDLAEEVWGGCEETIYCPTQTLIKIKNRIQNIERTSEYQIVSLNFKDFVNLMISLNIYSLPSKFYIYTLSHEYFVYIFS